MSADPAWALGYAVPQLRAIADCYRQHDKPYVHGAFGAVKENAVALWLKAGELGTYGTPMEVRASIVSTQLSKERWVDDFTHQRLQRVPAGGLIVRRLAYRPGQAGNCKGLILAACEERADTPVLLQLWQECAEDRELAQQLGFTWIGSKITAASEVVGLWGRNLPRTELRHAAQRSTLKKIGEGLPVGPVREALAGLEFAQHYSSYNKGKSWTAVALRGFSDDPLFIEKPAEMAKGWRDKNPAALAERCRWTTAWEPLKHAVQPLLDAMPCAGFERVRFMRLKPGGELTRHADITNPDAGIEDGMVARLHVPIETNGGAVFTMIDLEGRVLREHMAEGELWYLDQRKPHACVNGGETRTHLVVDAICDWRTRLALS